MKQNDETALTLIKYFFEQSKPLPHLLSTLRSRRVGRGYSIESGVPEYRSATRRSIMQERGPLAFKSSFDVVPLSEAEEAILAWSACGPNGIVHWDIAVNGGFREAVTLAGRTAAAAANSFAHDLLVINDNGAFIYNPGETREKTVEIEDEDDYHKILKWYRSGSQQVLNHRPDIDWALRPPGAPNAALFSPDQFNVNRDGQTWFIPISDTGWLYFSAMLNAFDAWHLYFVDDVTGEPAGLSRWIRIGQLEYPITVSQHELFVFQIETYPPGSYVQNIRLAAEAMGLGAWIFCGFFDDVLMGAMPEVAAGLRFDTEPPNPKAPLGSGAVKVSGVKGVKESTFVPSARFPDGRSVIEHVVAQRYARGAVLAPGEDNWMLVNAAPFKPDVVRRILHSPATRVSEWAIEAAIAHVDYCVDRYGQCPVYVNPMQCNFSAVVHHVDEEFYDQNYTGASITPEIREHFNIWH